jgi:hypothetical protein
MQYVPVHDAKGVPHYIMAKRDCYGDHCTLVNGVLNVYAKSERGTLYAILRAKDVECLDKTRVIPREPEKVLEWRPTPYYEKT